MKALTIRQPWAWLIVHGPKRIENRSWHLPPAMVGQRIYIHAAAGMTRVEYKDGLEFSGYLVPPFDDLPRGAIVGAATLVRCEHGPTEDDWHIPGQHGFVLANVLPFARPVSCKGALGFWTPNAATLAALSEG